MESARYFVPDHPTLVEVYSRDELRAFLQRGLLSRSDIVCDDETGLAHLLGDLLSRNYRDAKIVPLRDSVPTPHPRPSQISGKPQPKQANTLITHEFRADTPLTSVRPSVNTPPNAKDRNELISSFTTAYPPHNPYVEDEDLEEDDSFDDDEVRLSPGGLDLRFQQPSANNPQSYTTDSEFSKYPRDPLDRGFDSDIIDVDPILRRSEEEVLYMGHPSWIAFPRSLLGFLTFLSAAVYVWKTNVGFDWLMLFGSISGLFLVYIILERTSTTYFVTTHRIEYEFGIIGRNTKEVRIRDIRAIDVHQRGLKALLGLGTVEFDSSGSTGPEVIFKNVRRPHHIKELVRSLQIRQ